MELRTEQPRPRVVSLTLGPDDRILHKGYMVGGDNLATGDGHWVKVSDLYQSEGGDGNTLMHYGCSSIVVMAGLQWKRDLSD